jgi:hypothetical protein
MGIAQGFNPVTVRAVNVPVVHKVKMKDFTDWLERKSGGSPREISDRNKIKEILGLPKSVT